MIFKYEECQTMCFYEIDIPLTDLMSEPFQQYHYECIFELVAKDYFNNHDGNEDKWPLYFTLYDSNNNYITKASVSLEFNPEFFVNVKE